MGTGSLTLLVSLLCAIELRGQAPEGLGCIERLEVPRYTIFSRSAGLAGTAEVAVRLNQLGKIEKISVEGVNDILKREISERLSASVFSKACAATSVHLYFVFKLEGRATSGCFQSEISLLPPSRVVITTNPMAPIID
jgi:hypothetical protein